MMRLRDLIAQRAMLLPRFRRKITTCSVSAVNRAKRVDVRLSAGVAYSEVASIWLQCSKCPRGSAVCSRSHRAESSGTVVVSFAQVRGAAICGHTEDHLTMRRVRVRVLHTCSSSSDEKGAQDEWVEKYGFVMQVALGVRKVRHVLRGGESSNRGCEETQIKRERGNSDFSLVMNSTAKILNTEC